MEQKELWKQIEGHPKYWISSEGRAWSEKTNRFLTPSQVSEKDKHQKYSITENNVKKRYFIHRLVMMTFCPINNPENYQVNHIDGDPTNNRLENLEWTTEKENKKHYKEVVIPNRRKSGNFNLGAQPKNIKVTFPDGRVNYYIGIAQVLKDLNISSATFLRWREEKTGPVEIEYVDEIPEGYQNQHQEIIKKSIPRAVLVKYRDCEKEYSNGREADRDLGLKEGTINLWAKRETNKQTPTMRKLGILKVEFVKI